MRPQLRILCFVGSVGLIGCSASKPFTYEYRLKDDPCELVIDGHNHLMTANDVPSIGTVRHSGGFIRTYLFAPITEAVLNAIVPDDDPNNLEPRAAELFAPELQRLPGVPNGWAKMGGDVGMGLGAAQSRADKFVLLMGTYPEVDTYTPILVDLDGWAGRDTNQIPVHLRIEALSALMDSANVKYPGIIHPLLGYNPLHGIEETPVFVPEYRALLAEAIQEQGFVGFKTYPSNGYRPARNVDLEDPFLPSPAGIRNFDVTQSGIGDGVRFFYQLNDRDKLRYRRYLAQRVDEELEWLYDYAEKNRIPIVTHSSEVGAKLGKNYPETYGRPEYWRPVLEQHPNLILDIGHFGKGKRLIKEQPKRDKCFDEDGAVLDACEWSEVIISLIHDFPFVYTDLSHDGVPNRKFDEYVRELDALAERFPYMRERMFWGTDWYMLVQDPFADDYYDRYHEELTKLDPALERRVMGANAAEFYGFTGGPQRSRLQDYYQDRDWEFPQWLVYEGGSCPIE